MQERSIPINRQVYDLVARQAHLIEDMPHDCVKEPARLRNDVERETMQLENAETVVRKTVDNIASASGNLESCGA
jgi:hypothetical protein